MFGASVIHASGRTKPWRRAGDPEPLPDSCSRRMVHIQNMQRNVWLVLLFFAFSIGLGLRLINITEPHIVDFHSWRQGDTAAFTHGYLTETMNPLDPSLDRFPCEHRDKPFGRVEAELPVASWLAALPLAAMGATYPSAPYLRAISVLFFFGTCVYLFLLTVHLGESRETGAIAVLVFGVLPVSAFFTRTVQPDGPALFFSCAFVYHLASWMDGGPKAHAVASCIFAALTFLQKISGGFLFIPAIYLIVARRGFIASLLQWRLWAWGIGILVPVAAWHVHARSNPWTFGIWKDKYSTLSQLTDLNLWRVFTERAAFDILTWSGIILLILGLERFGRSRAVRVSTVWIGAVLVFIAATLPGNHTHLYYQLPLVLPASIVIAVAIVDLAKRGWTGRAVLAAMGVVHVITTREALTKYHQLSVESENAIGLLTRHVPRGSRIVSTDRNPALFYNAGIKAWFTASTDLLAAERCMGSDVHFLLANGNGAGRLNRSPSARNRFEATFEKVESTPRFTLWKKRAGNNSPAE